jgi:hypothetical protein
MVGAVLALPATGPEPAQADNIAIQIRLGIRCWNFIWRSLGEIKRHYWRPVSPKNCVNFGLPGNCALSKGRLAQPQRGRPAIPVK